MRGKDIEMIGEIVDIRITPAYAGKSCPFLRRTSPRRDHPRVCGEKQMATATAKWSNGDHPRVCGEKYCCTEIACRNWGSPPRMRGKVKYSVVLKFNNGITPAYAGKSAPASAPGVATPDHPRVCGEKDIDMVSAAAQIGSPPRMRGKEGEPGNDGKSPGITPAYAGKRSGIGTQGSRRWDHPRVCGEKLNIMLAAGCLTGSPPRMRGKAQRRFDGDYRVGITPAYAGKRLIL